MQFNVRFGDGVSRRGFLRVGALGTGLTLTDLLRLRSTEAAGGRPASDSAVIFVWLDGGPSHFETWDPKPQAPVEFRGPFTPIATAVPGVEFSEMLPAQARIADKLAIIRSCAHTNSDHGAGRGLCQWGYDLPGDTPLLASKPYPSIGSVTAKVRGPNRPGLPPYVHVPYPILYGQGGASFLGKQYDPYTTAEGQNTGLKSLQLSREVSVGRLADRTSLLRGLDTLRRDVDTSGMMETMDSFTGQAVDMVTSRAAYQAFDLSNEPKAVRDRYGSEGVPFLTARRLVESGVTFVTVNLLSWDYHTNLEADMRRRMPGVDHRIATLIEDLYERGLDRRVTVVVWGEFGRTPKINKDAGRDHWPQAMSVVLSGGGLKVGQVVGATDDRGTAPSRRKLHPNDVLATLYGRLGIDTRQTFINNFGRPITVLPHGEPIAELL